MITTTKYMKQTLLGLLLLFSSSIFSQNTSRIIVDGRILANDNEVENVTIFNVSSNKGTITDADGKFNISVALNDVLEISALQFEKMNVTINEDIINSKKITIFVIEHLNKLNEVLLLPYGLSGNLEVDLETVRTFNPDLDAIYFGLNNIDEYQFPDDHLSAVENPAFWETHRLQYGLNFGAIFGAVAKEIFKKDKGKYNDQKLKFPEVSKENQTLIDVYSIAFISDTFDIPEDRVNAFIVYVENDGLDQTLFDEGNEVQLLEFLVKESKEFLNASGVKD